jgi:hypothetical protein
MKRMRRSRSFWAKLIKEFQPSGEPQVVFARRKRVSLSTFQAWLRKMRQDSEPPVQFVELHAEPHSRQVPVEVVVGDGLLVRLAGPVSVDEVVELVTKLASRC